MGTKDIFVNLVGGLKIDDPAADLSIISAIASSTMDKYIEKDIILCGEVGLTGEVRSISHLNQRITEALSLGVKKAIVPSYGIKEKLKNVDMDLYPVKNMNEFEGTLSVYEKGDYRIKVFLANDYWYETRASRFKIY